MDEIAKRSMIHVLCELVWWKYNSSEFNLMLNINKKKLRVCAKQIMVGRDQTQFYSSAASGEYRVLSSQIQQKCTFNFRNLFISKKKIVGFHWIDSHVPKKQQDLRLAVLNKSWCRVEIKRSFTAVQHLESIVFHYRKFNILQKRRYVQ